MALAVAATMLVPYLGVILGGVAVRYGARHDVPAARKAGLVVTAVASLFSLATLVLGVGALLLPS